MTTNEALARIKTVNHFKLAAGQAGMNASRTTTNVTRRLILIPPGFLSCRFALRQTVSFYENRDKKQKFHSATREPSLSEGVENHGNS